MCGAEKAAGAVERRLAAAPGRCASRSSSRPATPSSPKTKVKAGAPSPKSSKGEKKDAKKQKPARDYFAPKTNIHVPNFNVVSDYEALHAGGFRQPAKYLRQQAPDHQLHRFGPGTAASMYEATAADFKWLEHMNADEPLEGKGSEVCTTTPNANYMRPEHLEKLFDVFEETSWAASAMPTQEQAAQNPSLYVATAAPSRGEKQSSCAVACVFVLCCMCVCVCIYTDVCVCVCVCVCGSR